MTTLTSRQQEIKTLLDEGLKATEIAEQLGVTRNAIYQQIVAIKKKGELDESYTPSGEVRLSPLQIKHSQAGMPPTSEETLRVITTLVETNARLSEQVATLSARLAERDDRADGKGRKGR